MDKYDYKIILQKAYDEGNTQEGLTLEMLEEIRRILVDERDKPNISSVFGVGRPEDMEGELCVFVSDAHIWKTNGHCADMYEDDASDILHDIGFAEEMDGHFSQSMEYLEKYRAMTKEEIIEKLSAIGFEYDEKFEEFMLDV